MGFKQGDNLSPILCILLIQAVAPTLDEKWNFATPDFRKHPLKKDCSNIASLQSKSEKESIKIGNWHITLFLEILLVYVDDAAYPFLSRKAIGEALKIIKSHFTCFGLTVHCGDKRNDGKSKTEAMYIPLSGRTATATDTADIIINEFKFFSYTDKFKYLGTIFTPSLKDDLDIQQRITQACSAFATMKRVFWNKDIPAKLRVQLYDVSYSDQHPSMGM